MPRKTKTPPPVLPVIPAELLEQFGDGPMTAEAINAATLALKKALIERALAGELNHHLGYSPGAAKPATVTNQRNGKGAKTVLTEEGPIRLEVPRDRDGSFEPILIPKHERRFTGFDDKIVAMYARGMTVREIQGFLLEQYGTEVSPEFISSVTDEVMAEVTAWQARPLEIMYPVVFFDALRVKIRQDAVVRNKAVYLQAFGGCGALYAEAVKRVTPVAFSELGPEALIELEVEDFPVIVAIDSHGGSVFSRP